MRDIAVLLLVLGSLPLILYRPYIGILVWSWLAYMNPHRLSYGFATDFPFAQIVAIVIMIALVFSKESKKMVWTRETSVLAFFVFWMLISTLNAVHPDLAWAQFVKVIKIQVVIFLTLMIMKDKQRLTYLAWAIVISLGFYGIKGGIFTVLTGGGQHVLGPPQTFIGGNNELGLALIMTIPLMRYLHLVYENKWIKLAMVGSIALTFIAVLGTQSRGALLGVAAMGFMLAWKSRKRVTLFLMLAALIPVGLMVMPDSWYERMSTIKTYEEDRSANERIMAWKYAYSVAERSPVVGGGYEIFVGRTDAHSIYFEVLAEHGFVGLFIFLLLGILSWRSCTAIRKCTSEDTERKWMLDLASMLQVSMLGYATSGLFLGMAYFDLYYHIVAMVIILNYLSKQEPDTGNLVSVESGKADVRRDFDVNNRFKFGKK